MGSGGEGEKGRIFSRPPSLKPRTEQHFAFNHRYQSLQVDSKRRALSSSGAEWETGSLRITPRPCTLACRERRWLFKLLSVCLLQRCAEARKRARETHPSRDTYFIFLCKVQEWSCLHLSIQSKLKKEPFFFFWSDLLYTTALMSNCIGTQITALYQCAHFNPLACLW